MPDPAPEKRPAKFVWADEAPATPPPPSEPVAAPTGKRPLRMVWSDEAATVPPPPETSKPALAAPGAPVMPSTTGPLRLPIDTPTAVSAKAIADKGGGEFGTATDAYSAARMHDPDRFPEAEITEAAEPAWWETAAGWLEPFDYPRRVAWTLVEGAAQALPNPTAPGAEATFTSEIGDALQWAAGKAVAMAASSATPRWMDLAAAFEKPGGLDPNDAVSMASNGLLGGRDDEANDILEEAGQKLYDAFATGKLYERATDPGRVRKMDKWGIPFVDIPGSDDWTIAYPTGRDILDFSITPDEAERWAATTRDPVHRKMAQWLSGPEGSFGREMVGLSMEVAMDPLWLLGPARGVKFVHEANKVYELSRPIHKAVVLSARATGTHPDDVARHMVRLMTGTAEQQQAARTVLNAGAEALEQGALRSSGESARLLSASRAPGQARAILATEIAAEEARIQALIGEFTTRGAGAATELATARKGIAAFRTEAARMGSSEASAAKYLRTMGQKHALQARHLGTAASQVRTSVRGVESARSAGAIQEAGSLTWHVPFLGQKSHYLLPAGGMGQKAVRLVTGPVMRMVGAVADTFNYERAVQKGSEALRVGQKPEDVLSSGEMLLWGMRSVVGDSEIAQKLAGVPLAAVDVLANALGTRHIRPYLAKLASEAQATAYTANRARLVMSLPFVGGRWVKLERVAPDLWNAYQNATTGLLRAQQAMDGQLMADVLRMTREAERVAGVRKRLARREIGAAREALRQATADLSRTAQGSPERAALHARTGHLRVQIAEYEAHLAANYGTLDVLHEAAAALEAGDGLLAEGVTAWAKMRARPEMSGVARVIDDLVMRYATEIGKHEDEVRQALVNIVRFAEGNPQLFNATAERARILESAQAQIGLREAMRRDGIQRAAAAHKARVKALKETIEEWTPERVALLLERVAEQFDGLPVDGQQAAFIRRVMDEVTGDPRITAEILRSVGGALGGGTIGPEEAVRALAELVRTAGMTADGKAPGQVFVDGIRAYLEGLGRQEAAIEKVVRGEFSLGDEAEALAEILGVEFQREMAILHTLVGEARWRDFLKWVNDPAAGPLNIGDVTGMAAEDAAQAALAVRSRLRVMYDALRNAGHTEQELDALNPEQLRKLYQGSVGVAPPGSAREAAARTLGALAAAGKVKFTPGQVEHYLRVMDRVAEGQVESGVIRSVDDFWKQRGFRWQEGGGPGEGAMAQADVDLVAFQRWLDERGPIPVPDTPEFRRWFGRSQVTDDTGGPLLVYHGTSGQGFEAFDPERMGRMVALGRGFYFTESVGKASEFTSSTASAILRPGQSGWARTPTGNVLPAWLSIRRPYMWGHKGARLPDDIHDTVMARVVALEAVSGAPGREHLLAQAVRDELLARGYDGVITADGGRREFVVFSPTQIKSPFNRGTFDPDDARILYQNEATAKGWIEILEDGRSIVTLTKKADLSTLFHEDGHLFRAIVGGRDMPDVDAFVVDRFGGWTVPAEEWFARQFEAYLRNGVVAAQPEVGLVDKALAALNRAFDAVAKTLTRIYKDGQIEDVHPTTRALFDRYLKATGRGEAAKVEPPRAPPTPEPVSTPRVAAAAPEPPVTKGPVPEAAATPPVQPPHTPPPRFTPEVHAELRKLGLTDAEIAALAPGAPPIRDMLDGLLALGHKRADLERLSQAEFRALYEFETNAARPARLNRRAPDPTPPKDVAGDARIPLMITRTMREQLRKAGLTDAEIDKLTPQQAWERLNPKGRPLYQTDDADEAGSNLRDIAADALASILDKNPRAGRAVTDWYITRGDEGAIALEAEVARLWDVVEASQRRWARADSPRPRGADHAAWWAERQAAWAELQESEEALRAARAAANAYEPPVGAMGRTLFQLDEDAATALRAARTRQAAAQEALDKANDAETSAMDALRAAWEKAAAPLRRRRMTDAEIDETFRALKPASVLRAEQEVAKLGEGAEVLWRSSAGEQPITLLPRPTVLGTPTDPLGKPAGNGTWWRHIRTQDGTERLIRADEVFYRVRPVPIVNAEKDLAAATEAVRVAEVEAAAARAAVEGHIPRGGAGGAPPRSPDVAAAPATPPGGKTPIPDAVQLEKARRTYTRVRALGESILQLSRARSQAVREGLEQMGVRGKNLGQFSTRNLFNRRLEEVVRGAADEAEAIRRAQKAMRDAFGGWDAGLDDMADLFAERVARDLWAQARVQGPRGRVLAARDAKASVRAAQEAALRQLEEQRRTVSRALKTTERDVVEQAKIERDIIGRELTDVRKRLEEVRPRIVPPELAPELRSARLSRDAAETALRDAQVAETAAKNATGPAMSVGVDDAIRAREAAEEALADAERAIERVMTKEVPGPDGLPVRIRILEDWETRMWADFRAIVQGFSPEDQILAAFAALRHAPKLPRQLGALYDTVRESYPRVMGRRLGDLPPELEPVVEDLSSILRGYEELYAKADMADFLKRPFDMLKMWGVVDYVPHLLDPAAKLRAGEFSSSLLGVGGDVRGTTGLDELLKLDMDAQKLRVIDGTIAEINQMIASGPKFSPDPTLLLARYMQANRAVTSKEFLLALIRGGVIRAVEADTATGKAAHVVAHEADMVPLFARDPELFTMDVELFLRGDRAAWARAIEVGAIREEQLAWMLDRLTAARVTGAKGEGSAFASWAQDVPAIQRTVDLEETLFRVKLGDWRAKVPLFDPPAAAAAHIAAGMDEAHAWDAVAKELLTRSARVSQLPTDTLRTVNGSVLKSYYAPDAAWRLYIPRQVAQSMQDTLTRGDFGGGLGGGFLKVMERFNTFWKTRVTILSIAFSTRNAVSNVFSNMLDLGPFGALNPRTNLLAGKLSLAMSFADEYGSLRRAMEVMTAPRAAGESASTYAARKLDYARARMIGLDEIVRVGLDLGDGTLRGADEAVDVLRQHGVLGRSYSGMADLFGVEQGLSEVMAAAGLGTKLDKAARVADIAEDVAMVGMTHLMTGGLPTSLGKAWGARLSRHVENQARATNFIAHMREVGDIRRAADHVDKFLFNYGDLTTFQRQYMRLIFPFFCVPEDHEILTKRGWRRHDELVLGEEVMAFDVQTHAMRWEPLLDVATFRFDGDLNEIRRRGGSFLCTDDHRWPVQTKRTFVKGKWYGGERKIKRTHELNTTDTIPLFGEFEDGGVTSVLSPRLAAILGWVVTDGYARWIGNYWEALVYQSPTNAKGTLAQIVELLGTTPRAPHPLSGVVAVPLALPDAQAITEAYREKADLPALVTRLSRDAAEAMWQAMFAAEGSTGRGVEQSFAQAPGPVLDAFQILSYMTGRAAWTSSVADFSKYAAKGAWRGNANIRRTPALDPHAGGTIRKVEYHGTIWCPKTPSGTWLMRHGGAVIPTGNTWTFKNIDLQLKMMMETPAYYSQFNRVLVEGLPRLSEGIDAMNEQRGFYPVDPNSPEALRLRQPHTLSKVRIPIPTTWVGFRGGWWEGLGLPIESFVEMMGLGGNVVHGGETFFGPGQFWEEKPYMRFLGQTHFLAKMAFEMASQHHVFYDRPLSALTNGRLVAQTVDMLSRVPIVGPTMAGAMREATSLINPMFVNRATGVLEPAPTVNGKANWLFANVPWVRALRDAAAVSDLYHQSLAADAREDQALVEIPSSYRWMDALFGVRIIQEDAVMRARVYANERKKAIEAQGVARGQLKETERTMIRKAQ